MSFEPTAEFWSGKRVLVTGHTGFKGAWLTCLLHELGADVCGYSLAPETSPSAFDAMEIAEICEHHIGDIRDLAKMKEVFQAFEPEVVLHLAAQPLVRLSYDIPLETFDVNVIGTANVLEACRGLKSLSAAVMITTDKCYENREWDWSYRETDPLGGKDPYSASKACSEIVTSAYRDSFFPTKRFDEHGVVIASARAGNVFGGGDWAKDRLIPDCIRAFTAGEEVELRMPHAVRPWQHVADALTGYLTLARACVERGVEFARGWNFGPPAEQLLTTEELVRLTAEAWGEDASYRCNPPADAPPEAGLLLLDSGLAARSLKWRPQLSMEAGIGQTVAWHKAHADNADAATLRALATSATLSPRQTTLKAA
ncbi:CDP-glucose 4,6-dehydratase [Blastopirellula marina]|uniref:CDP-glucose 4,6-dehydratase n=1 Tax=Blastopirellula marina TaxID=124 RepID=A0A2S8G6K8_9BACT|nr:CDP-glucose 4,6-dehydratase [Blastopirellula marina]PQO40043.1 CDP-glucose 4,6-dehydratase [Blastopirellula marina]PQO43662.1 CDP-glucose 4,6-dehydratase [Blastopirellula marina]PTL45418.1 CDP-glucose 4,6-dehydratase [Blastopirellula marina]